MLQTNHFVSTAQWRHSTLPGTRTDLAKIHLYFREVGEHVIKEYVLLDFIKILSSVGGAMGLFLGFSFLDCTLKVFKAANKIHEEKKQEAWN